MIRMDKKKIGKVLYRLFDGLLNLILLAFGAVVLWLLLQVSSIATFRIPTDSMEPALTAGDNILVNKWVMGARIFNLWDAAEGKDVKIRRLPAFGRIRRNDVLVFNFPYPAAWDSIGLDLLKYYVKRCIALPGDTLSIRQGHYHIAGYDGALGNEAAQNRMERMGEADFSPEVYASFPYDSLLGWNIREFGPLYVPKAGDEIEMDRTHYVLYKKVIEWEQRGTLTYRDSAVYLDGSPLPRYCFEKDYYFMGGDKAENSQDSRYWGLLPEEYIVGKVWKIWKSVDPYTDEFRWERFMKEVK